MPGSIRRITDSANTCNVQRFRGGLVFKAHRICVSLNSRLASNKEGVHADAGVDPPDHRLRKHLHQRVRIHFIIVMIRWTGLAPWEFEFPFPGSRASTFLYTFRCRGRSAGSPTLRTPAPQGCLAHKKLRPPLGSPYGPMHSPTVGSYGGAGSQTQRTPAPHHQPSE